MKWKLVPSMLLLAVAVALAFAARSANLPFCAWSRAADEPILFSSRRVVEPGPPPLLTSQGIVLVYNGADDNLVYRTGVAVFDGRDPRKVLYRFDAPIFSPEKEWEKTGQVPNVVFVEGMVRPNNRLLFYYGGVNKYVGVAEAPAK